MTDVQVVDQLPDTSKDASGANGTSAEVNVSKIKSYLVPIICSV